jgi:hypothetical protein
VERPEAERFSPEYIRLVLQATHDTIVVVIRTTTAF